MRADELLALAAAGVRNSSTRSTRAVVHPDSKPLLSLFSAEVLPLHADFDETNFGSGFFFFLNPSVTISDKYGSCDA